jgi:quinoprotein glucose dehydrogenase
LPPDRFARWGELALAVAPALAQPPVPDASWPTYGGDPGGQRYTSAAQINRQNVDQLQVAWTFHTGIPAAAKAAMKDASSEATPVLFKGSLYLSSPYDEVFAIDPETGAKRWSYDPQVDWGRSIGTIASRGVASWSSGQKGPGKCADRIFLGTLDGRLIALDAATGEACADFGSNGNVDLTVGVEYRKGDDFAITSPPTVVGDVVVIGSGIADNLRVDVELGVVRGYDARTGKLLWAWDPIPWARSQHLRTGAANTWSVIAADLEHGIVYLPVSSPSPDHYGGLRPGDNRDADSLVALDAKTGQKIWSFQIVHHDLWDYDLAAEPLLFTFHKTVPAVAIATKMGTLFAFNRLTGAPLYPVVERPVPKSDVPGEVAWPTQPFMDLPSFSPLTFDLSKPLGVTAEDDAACRKSIAGLRYEGVFTPPSMDGTLILPSALGGVNWGSTAFDPASGMIYANNNRISFVTTLKRRPRMDAHRELNLIKIGVGVFLLLVVLAAWALKGTKGLVVGGAVALGLAACFWLMRNSIFVLLEGGGRHSNNLIIAAHFGRNYGANLGTPYVVLSEPVRSPSGRPCSPPPWGAISAINLETGKFAWQTTLGTMVPNLQTGTWNVGGPLVTAGGLVFTGASAEPYLRAFDSSTGSEVWKAQLPSSAQATPMSYALHGKQYVVVSAGGHVAFGAAQADTIVGFALK